MENVKEQDEKDGKEQPSRKKGFRNLLIFMACIVFAILLINHFVAIQSTVTCSTMEGTLSEKDSVIVDKITYRIREPKRFEIVVYPFEESADEKEKEDIYFVKRIIGLPGETVKIDSNGVIYIDGEELQESYGNEPIDSDLLGLAADGITLREDEYFVLGDNRNNVDDSRDERVGNVWKEDMIGKVWLRLWPFNKIGFID